MAAHAARTRTRSHAQPAPRHPRRVSGPLRPLPSAPATRPGPITRGTTGVFERIRGLPDHRAVDRLLRSRAWIWLVGALLLGIVAMQVSLLKLNAGISRAVTTTSTLERQNAQLEAAIGRLTSGERVRAAAAGEGMVMPEAGAVAYLSVRPERDGRMAARRMQPPSDEAAAIMANGGYEPGVLAAAPLAPVEVAAAEVAPVAPAPVEPVAAAPVDPVAAAPVDPAAAAPVDPATAAVPADPAATVPADPAAG